jgi:Co/Zn/Cd efflux system component
MKDTTMSASCGHSHTFDGMDPTYKRRLVTVIAINAVMFAVEMIAGQIAGSQALQADSMDFFADALTYGLSLWVIGMPLVVRARAALVKGLSLAVIALWVSGSTIWHVFFLNEPRAEVMSSIGVLAFAANLVSVLLLMSYKDGDSNIRSVWLCSRNDAIGNVIVVLAGFGVWGTGTPWPDLAVAAIMATLFLWSAIQILGQSFAEMHEVRSGKAHGHDHAQDGHVHAHHDH